MTPETLTTLVSDITSAYLGYNRIASEEVPGLIEGIYTALSGLDQPAAVIETKPKPAVSIRSSVKPDSITCLECGTRMKILKRHLATEHNLSVYAYKERWNLPSSYKLVAADYTAVRRDLAKSIGLGRTKAEPVKPKPKPRRARTLKPKLTPATEPIAATA